MRHGTFLENSLSWFDLLKVRILGLGVAGLEQLLQRLLSLLMRLLGSLSLGQGVLLVNFGRSDVFFRGRAHLRLVQTVHVVELDTAIV